MGGTGAGEIYLSGDGRLWDWDIFGTRCRPGFPVEQGLAYASPHQVNDMHDRSQQVVDEGFVIRTRQGARVETRTLDKGGFANVTFLGQYPLGLVDYADPASPVRVQLDAFSPFIPSDVPDSTYPATILSYTVENPSRETVECTVGGWMENATGIDLRNDTPIQLENAASKGPGYTALNLLLKEAALPQVPPPRHLTTSNPGSTTTGRRREMHSETSPRGWVKSSTAFHSRGSRASIWWTPICAAMQRRAS